MRDEFESPVDIGGGEGARPLRWASVTIAVATLFLLITNAASINGWAAELEPSPATARLTRVTEGWLRFTEATGLAAPRAALHARWQKLQAARF